MAFDPNKKNSGSMQQPNNQMYRNVPYNNPMMSQPQKKKSSSSMKIMGFVIAAVVLIVLGAAGAILVSLNGNSTSPVIQGETSEINKGNLNQVEILGAE